MKEKNLGELFESFENQWDVEEPVLGHQQRFMERLAQPKKKKFPYKTILSIAAALVICFGIYIQYQPSGSQSAVAAMSPEVKESHLYFNSLIKKELAIIQQENSPESKIIVRDAMAQLDALDKDYNKLVAEMAEKGESTQIIYAMIQNLQTRVNFLQQVVKQIENIKKLKSNYNEKTT
ncbi:anti-sigma factor [Flavobacterium sp. 3HN19-14]|uniref:anti-sigma factor n=1 Tax=Flavobacterium sp. 3HN19-14 TaxID=3448133 RepID=UPI003EDFF934